MRSGVYKITSPSGKLYVGSAENLSTRWAIHKAELKKGIHHCRALQAACEKYGINSLEFEVLERHPIEGLRALEQEYINRLRPEYNSTKVVDSPSPLNRAIAREHMLRLNQMPWSDERRAAARERLARARPWAKVGPWTQERRVAQSERMKLRHANRKEPA